MMWQIVSRQRKPPADTKWRKRFRPTTPMQGRETTRESAVLTIIQKTRGSLNRREMLRIGTAGIGSLTLAGLLNSGANAALGRALHDRSVIVLNLQLSLIHI